MFLTLLQSQVGPVPVLVIPAKRSGGNANANWLRVLVQADLNTYRDKSHVALGGIELEEEVAVVRPIVKPDNSSKVLRKIETNLTRVIVKASILDMYDEFDTKHNILDIYEEEE